MKKEERDGFCEEFGGRAASKSPNHISDKENAMSARKYQAQLKEDEFSFERKSYF